MIHSYRDLIVWQKGIELVIEVYVLTDRFPSNERFGLTSQMRRAAVSIPSNIAEGKLRGHNKECKRSVNSFSSFRLVQEESLRRKLK
mgnify:CR=1 FL=1